MNTPLPNGYYWYRAENGDLDVVDVESGEISFAGSDEPGRLRSWPDNGRNLRELDGEIVAAVSPLSLAFERVFSETLAGTSAGTVLRECTKCLGVGSDADGFRCPYCGWNEFISPPRDREHFGPGPNHWRTLAAKALKLSADERAYIVSALTDAGPGSLAAHAFVPQPTGERMNTETATAFTAERTVGSASESATAEQLARDMLERIGVPDVQSYSAGSLVELANLIARDMRL